MRLCLTRSQRWTYSGSIGTVQRHGAQQPWRDRGAYASEVEALAEFCRMRNNADLMGRLVYDDEGDVVFQFGKHTGKRVKTCSPKTPVTLAG